MKESQIEKKIADHVKKLGGVSYKFTSPSNRGVPDRIVLFPGGRVMFLEVKQEKGKLSALQQRHLERLKDLGFVAEVAYGLDGGVSIVEAFAEGEKASQIPEQQKHTLKWLADRHARRIADYVTDTRKPTE